MLLSLKERLKNHFLNVQNSETVLFEIRCKLTRGGLRRVQAVRESPGLEVCGVLEYPCPVLIDGSKTQCVYVCVCEAKILETRQTKPFGYRLKF